MSTPLTMLMTIQPQNFGGTERGPPPVQVARVGLIKDYGDLGFNQAQEVFYSTRIRRWGLLSVACGVTWRIEGTGSVPFLAEHFSGGVFPSGTATFGAGASQEHTLLFALAAIAPPVLPITGRIYLDDPVGCEIGPAQAEITLLATSAIINPSDALVTLSVPFTEIKRDAPPAGSVWVNAAGLAWKNAASEEWKAA